MTPTGNGAGSLSGKESGKDTKANWEPGGSPIANDGELVTVTGGGGGENVDVGKSMVG